MELHPAVMDNINRAGYSKPTPIYIYIYIYIYI